MGEWFRHKALELVVAGACAVAVAYISITFVSQEAYASDQAELVTAINKIAPAITQQLEIQRLQREIRETNTLKLRLQRYLDADPDSALAAARRQEISFLQDQKQMLELELEVAMKPSES